MLNLYTSKNSAVIVCYVLLVPEILCFFFLSTLNSYLKVFFLMMSGIGFIQSWEKTHTQFVFLSFITHQDTKQAKSCSQTRTCKNPQFADTFGGCSSLRHSVVGRTLNFRQIGKDENAQNHALNKLSASHGMLSSEIGPQESKVTRVRFVHLWGD